MMRFVSITFVLGLLAAGCMSPAERLEPSIVKSIREGFTTRDEVHKTLGKPRQEVNGSNQKRLATYQYSRLKPEAAVPTPSALPDKAGTYLLRTFSVLYDEHDTVEQMLFYETSTPLYRQMSTVWVGQAITDRETARILKGASGEGELESMFGPPTARGLTIEGTPVMAWSYVQIKSRFELREAQQTLFVYLSRSGIVQDFAIVGNLSLTESEKRKKAK